ncbi:MAG TPA: DUF4838 domain-containing protein [Candidatus Acidoferrales bacterium]|nr:DUF4838 domain-containing protein [Candidatus Acidoferrales bacterium]
MLRFDRAFVAGATIHLPSRPAKAIAFAADELRRYLHRMTGATLPLLHGLPENESRLVIGPADPARARQRATTGDLEIDNYSFVADESSVALAGGSARAVLDATYHLLETLGCRWSLHGAHEEVVRHLESPVAISSMRQRSPFRLRGYTTDIMTFHYTQPEQLADRLDDDRTFIDWMGKSGANTFFYIRHPFDTQLSIPELHDDFNRRGIGVEYGGHVIPLLLPRELFAQHPEYFPAGPDGQRSELGNLCTSNRNALATVSANAGQYVRDFPEMQALHIWGADLWKGGWCHCSDCRGVSVQDQSLRACNAVARGLAEAGFERPVCYLAYHDTLEANLRDRPDPQVVCEFAPRERCYGHAINDPDCARNRRHAAALESYVEHFEGRVRLFEYYGDAILFFGCAVPLTRVIEADLDYYSRLGIRDILMLQFGGFSVWSYPLNHLAFAARTTRRATNNIIPDYCSRFDRHADSARDLFAQLETVMGSIVTYGDIRIRPRQADDIARLRSALTHGLPQLATIAEGFEATHNEALHAAAQLVRYTQMVLEGIASEIESGAPADTIYARALQLIEAVDRRYKGLWGSVDLPIIHNFYTAAGAMLSNEEGTPE